MLLNEHPSEYIVAAFDSRGPTKRHEKYAEYKAHRPAMEDDLAVQIPVIQQLINAFGVPRLAEPGYEADDLIGTLVQMTAPEGLPVLIVSGDKDLMQLVNDRVKVLKPSREPGRSFELVDALGVERHLGVPPGKVADYLALTGDAVDNVPGVPGIGKVTAKKLLEEFGSLDGLLGKAEQIANVRARDALLNHLDQAKLSRELVELERVPFAEGAKHLLERCRKGESNREELRSIFERLEFQSLLKEMGLIEPKRVSIKMEIVLSLKELDELCTKLSQAKVISIDLETTSQDPMRAEIVGISLALTPGQGFYIPLAHDDPKVGKQLSLEATLAHLKPILEDPHKEIIGQNIKYDMKVLARYEIHLEPIAFDSLIAAYLLDPASLKDLNALAQRYLDRTLHTYQELGQEDFRKVPIEEAANYSTAHAETVVCLREPLTEKLKADGLWELFTDIELPLIPILAEMELKGVLLDPKVLQEQGLDLRKQIEVLQSEMTRLAEGEFNPSSPKQVAEVLFERLKLKPLKPIKKTKSGVSTNAQVLSELAEIHPLPELILRYRELEKLLGTYVEKLPTVINPETGRIHTTFNQSVTATGRLSSSDPNLQNIPVRTELGGHIRRAFVAPPGRFLLGADYSQIELRVLAHLSGDPALTEAFKTDEDLHIKTASEIFNVSREKVDARQRGIAKRINFGIIYGISAYRLARELGLSQEEAKNYIDRYYARYAKVKEFIAEQIHLAEVQGYVTTITGRRRYLPDINSRNWARRSYEQRNATNAPVQGTAADIMKLTMLRVHENLKKSKLHCDMLLQIHDELLFEVDEADAEKASTLIKQTMEQTMEQAMELSVPLKVEVNLGHNWGEI
jgi:DNA polymerase-1